jgi:rhodanese-related sulfurtransferase
VPRIRPQDLKARLDAGEKLTVVDARSRESYARRHIPGALSIPLPEIEEHFDELPESGDIIFYCT